MPPLARPPFYKSLAPLLQWPALPRPVDWSGVFGRRAPLTLEIGTGNGEFMARTAAAEPDHDFVGIDLRWSSIKRVLRNVAKAQLANVRLVNDDVRPFLERAFAPRSLARVFVLFPCPWRKEQHAHHRLFSRQFLATLNPRLVDGGEIVLVTDWTPFAEWTLANVPGSGFRVGTTLVPARLDTKYERKWAEQGQQQFHELHLTKIDHLASPFPEDLPLNPPLLDAVDLDRLAPVDRLGEEAICFKEIVRDRERQVALIRTVVVEEPLTQHLWIAVARGEDGKFWVMPARGCQTIPTAGVQQALELIAQAGRESVKPA